MPIRTARLFRDELALPRRWVGFGGEVPPLNLKAAASLVQRKGIAMRELTTDELDLVSGGIILSSPVLSFSFTPGPGGAQGTVTFNGITQPIGAGHPSIVLP